MTGQAAPGRRLPGHSSNRIAPWPWAGQRRSPYVTRHPACCFESSSGWVVGAHSSRYARPSSCVPATHGPSNPDFHSCRPPPPRAALVWSRARVRDNSFTSGDHGPLHRRRSRVEGKQMHSTTAQPSSRQRACPYQPSCAAPFTGGATLDGHRVRRGTGACARLEEVPAPS